MPVESKTMQQTRLLKAVLFASALTLGTSGLALAAPAQTSTLDTAVSSHFMAADSMASQDIIAAPATNGLVSENYADDMTTANVGAITAGLTSAGYGANTYGVTSEYGAVHEVATTAGYQDELNVLSYALVTQDRGAEHSGTFYREDDLFVQAVSKRVVQTAAIADTVDQSAYVMTAAGALYQIADLELEVNDPAAGLAEQTLNADAFYVSALG